ncbi:MAG: hypothetical protein H0T53_03130 [Herpetosiphonaceae bacterium]|nr:hypothetical protein [Herpetosiphonaceae bacterium]
MHSTISNDTRPARWTLRDLALGALAGVIGGLAMGLVGMLVAAVMGFSVWKPLAEIAGVFSPALASTSPTFNVSAVLLGTLVHFGISAVLGMVFAAVFRGIFNLPSSWGFPLLYGFIYGIVIWFISSQILANVLISGRDNTPSFIAQHLVFGAVTGLAFGLLRPARAYLPRY